jgi:hypothetical protein
VESSQDSRAVSLLTDASLDVENSATMRAAPHFGRLIRKPSRCPRTLPGRGQAGVWKSPPHSPQAPRLALRAALCAARKRLTSLKLRRNT